MLSFNERRFVRIFPPWKPQHINQQSGVIFQLPGAPFTTKSKVVKLDAVKNLGFTTQSINSSHTIHILSLHHVYFVLDSVIYYSILSVLQKYV